MKKFIALFIAVFWLSAAVSAAAGEIQPVTGTGIIVGVKDGYMIVKGIYRNSPAERAGLRTGDRLMQINGKTDFYRSHSGYVEKLVNPPVGAKVILKISRYGTKHDFTLTGASIPVIESNLPKSEVPDGRIKEVKNGLIVIADYSQRGPVSEGDRFYVVLDRQIIGKVGISRFNDGACHLSVNPGMVGTHRDKLAGAKLVFYQDSGRSNRTAMKDPAQELDVETARKNVPGEEMVAQYMKRKDLEKDAGEVITHDPKNRTLMVKVIEGRSSSPLGPTQIMVTTRYKFVHLKYLPTVPMVPSDVPVKDIKTGDHIGFFFKRQGDTFFAHLLHKFTK